MKTLELL